MTAAMKSPLKLGLLIITTLSTLLSAVSHGQDSQDNDSDVHTKISVLPLEDLRVFTKAYDHIRNAYVREIDDRTLLEYAIRGMLNELDPHSTYLDASSFDELQVHTTGEFGGLGIEVGIEDGYVKVISPIDDTPAAAAGVQAGDLIIKINDVTVKGLSLKDAVEKMRGPKGSEITITLLRKGLTQPFDLTLVRDTVKVRSVKASMKEGHFAYIRIAQFQVHTGQDVAKAFEKLKSESAEIKGLVLDLRNNPGGVLQASVEVADQFIEDGLIVYTEGRLKDSNVQYEANPGDITDGLPIVVLINGGSASASEIVAGALQDQGRAIIIGTRSFGKGSVQSVIPITNDRAIKITTALYYTPQGRSIQAEGITPDIEVEPFKVSPIEQHSRIKESNLSGHLANGNNTKKKKKKKKKKSKSKSNNKNSSSTNDDKKTASIADTDSQLYEAITLLKGLDLFIRQEKKRLDAKAAKEAALKQAALEAAQEQEAEQDDSPSETKKSP